MSRHFKITYSSYESIEKGSRSFNTMFYGLIDIFESQENIGWEPLLGWFISSQWARVQG